MKHLVFFLVLFSACSSPSERQSFDLLITNVQIVDVKDNKIMTSQWVGITGDEIISTGDMSSINVVHSETVLNGEGQFLMPGLWDNHVHFRGGDSLIMENKQLLQHFISHGITTVRDAGGDITPAVKDWQEQIAKGSLEGPNIFTSGPKLDGSRPAWAGSIQVTDSISVNRALDSLSSLGVDYVKVYDGSLTAETFYEIIQQAEQRNLKVTGHMPLSAKLMDAITLGLDGTEHMYYLLKACSNKEDSLTSLGLGYGMMGELLATYDEGLASEVFSRLSKKQVFVTPTLYIGKVLSGLAWDDHSGDSLLQYMGAGIQKTYEGRINSAKRNASSLSQNRSALGDQFRAMILPMHQAGVPILAGSDCGPYNSFVYPGNSLIEEINELVYAGMSITEALKASMVLGPAFLGLSENYGSVTAGKKADLILLKKNPLESIDHLYSLQKVIKAGEIIER